MWPDQSRSMKIAFGPLWTNDGKIVWSACSTEKSHNTRDVNVTCVNFGTLVQNQNLQSVHGRIIPMVLDLSSFYREPLQNMTVEHRKRTPPPSPN